MTIVLLHDNYSEKKLTAVINEMKVMGPPTIRVYDLGFDNLYQAIEGCHRLRAAELLDLDPIIVEVESSNKIWDLEIDNWDEYQEDDTLEILGDYENKSISF